MSAVDYFGFYGRSDDLPDYYYSINKYNVAGYCPIVGIGTACIRFAIAAKTPDMSMSLRVTLVIRGIIEALGGGLLFLIPDLIVTIGRYLCKSCFPSLNPLNVPSSPPRHV